MRFALTAVILLSATTLVSGQVKTSDFLPRWQVVAAPHSPVSVVSPWEIGQHSAGRWNWPYPPNPEGTFEVCNAIVDKQHKVGAWSQPFRFTAKSGWRIKCGGWNQPPQYEESGLVWKFKVIHASGPATETSMPGFHRWQAGFEYLITNTAGLDAAYQSLPHYYHAGVVPFNPTAPVLEEYRPFVYADDNFKLSKLTYGGRYSTVAPPPVVVVSNLPINVTQVGYAYETETGQTAISPVCNVVYPPSAHVPASTSVMTVILPNESPMGATGVRVYVKVDASPNWIRVVSPDCHKAIPNTNDPNDWVFPLDSCRLELWRIPRGTPGHVQSPEPKSMLSSLQVAMLDQKGDIDVDEDQVVSCPIVHNFWVQQGQTTFRQIDFNNRKVSVVHSGQCSTTWPVWVNHSSYTTIKGMVLDAQSSNCMAGIAFSGWGSGSFGNQFEDCRITLRNQSDVGVHQPVERLTTAFRITNEGQGLYGHTASEIKTLKCKYAAAMPIMVQHPQSANNVFDTTHAISSYNVSDRRYTVFYSQTASTQVEFRGDLYCDCPFGSAIFTTHGGNTLCTGKIWVDVSYRCLWQVMAGGECSLTISGGKLNIRPPAGERACLVRSFADGTCNLWMTNIIHQPDPGTSTDYPSLSFRPNRLGLHFQKTKLVETASIYEPTSAQFEQELQYIYGRQVDGLLPEHPRQELGFNFDYFVPGTITVTVPLSGNSFTVVSDVKKTGAILYNSTQYKQLVSRPSWKD